MQEHSGTTPITTAKPLANDENKISESGKAATTTAIDTADVPRSTGSEAQSDVVTDRDEGNSPGVATINEAEPPLSISSEDD